MSIKVRAAETGFWYATDEDEPGLFIVGSTEEEALSRFRLSAAVRVKGGPLDIGGYHGLWRIASGLEIIAPIGGAFKNAEQRAESVAIFTRLYTLWVPAQGEA